MQLRSEQLSEEREKCRVLQESLRVLAVQHHELEQQIETSGGYSISPPTLDEEGMMSSASIGSSDDEFYECDVSDRGEYPDSNCYCLLCCKPLYKSVNGLAGIVSQGQVQYCIDDENYCCAF